MPAHTEVYEALTAPTLNPQLTLSLCRLSRSFAPRFSFDKSVRVMSRRPNLFKSVSGIFAKVFSFHTLWPTIWWNPSNLSDSRRDYASKRSPHVKFPSKENKPFSLLVLVEPFGGALSETPNLYYHRWGARIDTVHTPLRSISIRSHDNSIRSSEQSPTQVLSWPNVVSVFKRELMLPTWIATS